MLRNVLLISLVLLVLPTLAIAYPAPKPEELPQKAHGYLGLELAANDAQDIAFIYRTRADSPAQHAGLQRWDILREIDDRPIYDPKEVLNRIASCRPGTLVAITVQRGDVLLTVFAKIGCRTATMSETESDRIIDTGEEEERQTGVVEGVGEEFLQ